MLSETVADVPPDSAVWTHVVRRDHGDDVPVMLSCVIAENVGSRRLVRADLPWMPTPDHGPTTAAPARPQGQLEAPV